MFSRILLASDLSPTSECILECHEAFRRMGVEEIILCHAHGLRHLRVLQAELARKVAPELNAQKARLEEQGFRVRVIQAPGPAAEEINRIAAEERARLIVLGAHREPKIPHLYSILGSVACEVLHSHRLPVLVIRTIPTEKNGKATCLRPSCQDFARRILFPTDFSPNSDRAFQHLLHFAEHGAREIILLHVQDQRYIEKYLKDKLDDFNSQDRARLQNLAEQLYSLDVWKVECIIRYGHPVTEILKLAAKTHPSLLLMGSQGKGRIKELVLGSTSHNVTRQVGCSVMLVPDH